jgi:regulator of cell morphogenesis and NO signaling
MSITHESRVGRLAAEHPLATRVFARHQIDYCCGGGRPIGEVCTEKGLDTDRVLDEIRRELETTNASEENWNDRPLPDLIDHILATYHRPLDGELPRLAGMARKVLAVHGDKDPERLAELVQVYEGLMFELIDHMAKEEEILFPMIRNGQGSFAEGPVAVMLHEHDDAGAALKRLRELTNNYEVPAEACNTWRALWHGLAALEDDMHRHIHLENNILFPAALGH